MTNSVDCKRLRALLLHWLGEALNFYTIRYACNNTCSIFTENVPPLFKSTRKGTIVTFWLVMIMNSIFSAANPVAAAAALELNDFFFAQQRTKWVGDWMAWMSRVLRVFVLALHKNVTVLIPKNRSFPPWQWSKQQNFVTSRGNGCFQSQIWSNLMTKWVRAHACGLRPHVILGNKTSSKPLRYFILSISNTFWHTKK